MRTTKKCLYRAAHFFVVWLLLVHVVEGQDAEPPVKKKAPEPETLKLVTKDSVVLNCRFFPGSPSKKTVPIILVHGWDGPRGAGSGRDCYALAERLHKEGHAVAVPDLRGHGNSVVRRTTDGRNLAIERNRLRAQDFHDMQKDIEAVKRLLVEKNNAEELNIELLCLVGFEMGAVIGLNWVNYDWSVPVLPTFKQGQDVKAFVLVSPDQASRGVQIRPALANEHIQRDLSAMIIYGRQTRKRAEAGRRIYNALKRNHRPIPSDPRERELFQDLFLFELDTSLQGTKVLSASALGVPALISKFVQVRLANQADDHPWQHRTRP